MRDQSGFSLIELLVVVAIILIVMAIAIPNFLRSRMAANEASAVSSVRTLANAQTTYYATYPTVGYAAQMSFLGGANPCTASASTACLIDPILAGATSVSASKAGYYFTLSGDGLTPSAYYSFIGKPTAPGRSGQREFFIDPSGFVRFTADGTDPSTASSAI